jgi:hypothetical protein
MCGWRRSSFMVPPHNSQRGGTREVSESTRIAQPFLSVMPKLI